jgi:hypothetical protein
MANYYLVTAKCDNIIERNKREKNEEKLLALL